MTHPMHTLHVLMLLFLTLLSGCLDYEEIEVRAVADPARDRIDLCIVSRGIFVRRPDENTGERALTSELEELLSLRDHAAFPLMGTAPLDLTKVIEDERDPEAAKRAEGIRRKILEFVELEPGLFHLDDDDRLCLYQFVRIHRVGAFVAWVNETLGDETFWADYALDAETKQFLTAFLASKERFMALDGTGIRFRMPCSDSAHADMLDEVFKAARESSERQGESEQRHLRTLLDDRVAAVRHERHTDFYFGTQGARVGTYWFRDKLGYQPDLLERLVAKHGNVDELADELLVAAFDAFRERDAQEPEAVLAARKALGLSGGK